MKRLVLLAFALAGCRTVHLGPDTGLAYRAALEAQRESDADEVASLDSDDAKMISELHHRTAAAQRPGSGTSSGTTTTSSSGSGSSGLWQGASGNITMEAK